MAGDPFRPINQQKPRESLTLTPQNLCAFRGLRHEGIISKIRHRQPRTACTGRRGHERLQFSDLRVQPVIVFTRPAMGGGGNRDSHIGKSRAVQHHQRVPAAA